MTRAALIALWSWFRNHPAATFQEFSDAFDRAQRLEHHPVSEAQEAAL
jgi:hypothetical protein